MELYKLFALLGLISSSLTFLVSWVDVILNKNRAQNVYFGKLIAAISFFTTILAI